MKKGAPLWLAMSAASLATAGAWIYSRRERRRVASVEGLDDPEAARAFNWVARLPQMALLRRHIARRAVAMTSGGEAIDLGCGPGYLVLELAHQASGLRVAGIDLSEEMLAEGRRSAERSGLSERVSFRQGDAAQIPYPDGSLDLVVSTLSLHHWSDPVAVFDEVARVLRPGGAFLIFDLRRDMAPPAYVFLWFVTHCIVPAALRRVGEPLGSRNASYTPREAAWLVGRSRLGGWRVTAGPLWLTIESLKH